MLSRRRFFSFLAAAPAAGAAIVKAAAAPQAMEFMAGELFEVGFTQFGPIGPGGPPGVLGLPGIATGDPVDTRKVVYRVLSEEIPRLQKVFIAPDLPSADTGDAAPSMPMRGLSFVGI